MYQAVLQYVAVLQSAGWESSFLKVFFRYNLTVLFELLHFVIATSIKVCP